MELTFGDADFSLKAQRGAISKISCEKERQDSNLCINHMYIVVYICDFTCHYSNITGNVILTERRKPLNHSCLISCTRVISFDEKRVTSSVSQLICTAHAISPAIHLLVILRLTRS